MTRKDFFLGFILGLIVFSFLFIGYAHGQDQQKTDSSYVWIKADVMKKYFQDRLDEENKRHDQVVLFIQGQISVCESLIDSVKVKK